MSKSDKNNSSSTMEIRLSVQRSLKENLSRQARTGLLERRSGNDRRGWGKMPEIPFEDSHGISVSKDRRLTPERRVSNMAIDWGAHYPDQGEVAVDDLLEPDSMDNGEV